jgi:hypothetical protein
MWGLEVISKQVLASAGPSPALPVNGEGTFLPPVDGGTVRYLVQMIREREYRIAAGYEDSNDGV